MCCKIFIFIYKRFGDCLKHGSNRRKYICLGLLSAADESTLLVKDAKVTLNSCFIHSVF